MSKILIVIDDKSVDISVLKELHKISGGSLANIRTAISKGLPIVDMEIFDNQYEEKASLLRRLISLIQNSEIGVKIYEISESSYFDVSNMPEDSLISLEVLVDILNSSDDEMDRQLDM